MTETHVHAPVNSETEPRGDLCIRTLAMPADTNANGDIFGGWLLSQMDIGGGVFASKIAKSRTVTVYLRNAGCGDGDTSWYMRTGTSTPLTVPLRGAQACLTARIVMSTS